MILIATGIIVLHENLQLIAKIRTLFSTLGIKNYKTTAEISFLEKK
jgi:hypothetical protein